MDPIACTGKIEPISHPSRTAASVVHEMVQHRLLKMTLSTNLIMVATRCCANHVKSYGFSTKAQKAAAFAKAYDDLSTHYDADRGVYSCPNSEPVCHKCYNVKSSFPGHFALPIHQAVNYIGWFQKYATRWDVYENKGFHHGQVKLCCGVMISATANSEYALVQSLFRKFQRTDHYGVKNGVEFAAYDHVFPDNTHCKVCQEDLEHDDSEEKIDWTYSPADTKYEAFYSESESDSD